MPLPARRPSALLHAGMIPDAHAARCAARPVAVPRARGCGHVARGTWHVVRARVCVAQGRLSLRAVHPSAAAATAPTVARAAAGGQGGRGAGALAAAG